MSTRNLHKSQRKGLSSGSHHSSPETTYKLRKINDQGQQGFKIKIGIKQTSFILQKEANSKNNKSQQLLLDQKSLPVPLPKEQSKINDKCLRKSASETLLDCDQINEENLQMELRSTGKTQRMNYKNNSVIRLSLSQNDIQSNKKKKKSIKQEKSVIKQESKINIIQRTNIFHQTEQKNNQSKQLVQNKDQKSRQSIEKCGGKTNNQQLKISEKSRKLFKKINKKQQQQLKKNRNKNQQPEKQVAKAQSSNEASRELNAKQSQGNKIIIPSQVLKQSKLVEDNLNQDFEDRIHNTRRISQSSKKRYDYQEVIQRENVQSKTPQNSSEKILASSTINPKFQIGNNKSSLNKEKLFDIKDGQQLFRKNQKQKEQKNTQDNNQQQNMSILGPIFQKKIQNSLSLQNQQSTFTLDEKKFKEFQKIFNIRKEDEENEKSQQIKQDLFNLQLPIQNVQLKQQAPKLDFEQDELEIVDNNNQRIKIKVQRLPFDSSTGGLGPKKRTEKIENEGEKEANEEGVSNLTEKKVNKLEQIVNLFDIDARKEYFSQQNFIRDYQTGYIPISIQDQQEKEITKKVHFIKRKQSQANLNLKRTVGVSYVKMSESQQLNVNKVFKLLPPLVFQCSSGCERLTKYNEFMDKTFDRLFKNNSNWLLCTYFESDDELIMRQYLLYPEKRFELAKGQYFLVKNFEQIWPFFLDKMFFCIHFFYDQDEFIRSPELKKFTLDEIKEIVQRTNIHLGFYFKKSLSGKKLFLKTLGEYLKGENAEIQSKMDEEEEDEQVEENKNNGDEDKNKVKEVKEEFKQEVNENSCQQCVQQISQQIENNNNNIQICPTNVNVNINSQESQNNSIQQKPEQSEPKKKKQRKTKKNQEEDNILIDKLVNSVKSSLEKDDYFQQFKMTSDQMQNMEKYLKKFVKQIKEQQQSQQQQTETPIVNNNQTGVTTEVQKNENEQLKQEGKIEEEINLSNSQMQQCPMIIEDNQKVNQHIQQLPQNNFKYDSPDSLKIKISASSIINFDTQSTEYKIQHPNRSDSNSNDQQGIKKEEEITESLIGKKTPADILLMKDQNLQISQEVSTISRQTSRQMQMQQDICNLTKVACKEIMDYLEKEENSKTINTLATKLELYVNEQCWHDSNKFTKNLLNTFILYAKDQFEGLSLQMMNKRFLMIKEKNIQTLNETINQIRQITENDSNNVCNIMQIEDSNPLKVSLYLSSNIQKQHQNNKWQYSEQSLQKHLNKLKQQEIDQLQNDDQSKEDQQKQICEDHKKLISQTKTLNLAKLLGKSSEANIINSLSLYGMPLYYINTRDSFAYDLIEKVSYFDRNGHQVKKIEYFFDPENHPQNFKSFVNEWPDYRVGGTSYHNFFSHEELLEIEKQCFETEQKGFQRHFLPMTTQVTCTGDKLKRTKFFFGYRYIWSKVQLNEPHSFVGAGVRCDVSDVPTWMPQLIVSKLEDYNIIPKNFINSLALNVYHDGKEGLAQHFDDATRFKQPIFTLRLFSDSRLSFGSQFYGFCNGAFCVPLPRGCVFVMEENSYAANGIKHCVRPCDMTGKSAAIIMRQMHEQVVKEAQKFDYHVDLPTWFSTLSVHENAIPYGEQKKIEAELIEKTNTNKLQVY